MNKIDEALDYFSRGFVCSQAVLASHAEELGLEHDMAMKMATGFGGGMARLASTCGAVTGAMMVIGLKYGRVRLEEPEASEKTYKLIQELTRRMEEKFGSVICKEILGVDISTNTGREKAISGNLFGTRCPEFIKYTMEILEEIL